MSFRRIVSLACAAVCLMVSIPFALAAAICPAAIMRIFTDDTALIDQGTTYLTIVCVFSIGLFMVCTLKLNLFTGKACYLPGKNLRYVAFLGLVWVGNLLGAQLVASLLKVTRVGPALA